MVAVDGEKSHGFGRSSQEFGERWHEEPEPIRIFDTTVPSPWPRDHTLGYVVGERIHEERKARQLDQPARLRPHGNSLALAEHREPQLLAA